MSRLSCVSAPPRARARACPALALALVAVVVAAGVARPASAASRTALSFTAAPDTAEYSQGVGFELALLDLADRPLDGATACGAEPCRVVLTMRAADGSGAAIQITEPDVVVDAAGRARARLFVVDGRYGGALFRTDADGLAYTITARFAGAGAPLPDGDDADCLPDAAGTPDGRLCPATTTTTLALFPEVPALSFGEDVVVRLGDTVTLAATLTDPNGDAVGDAVDGPGSKALVGLPVRFAYDANANGRPDFQGGELLGEALTNDFGVASFTFTADPAFVTAGDFEAGLHAEFPGDDRYGVARTSIGLLVEARSPDAGRTIVEVDPQTIPANGVATATVTVKLVDPDNNLLGPDSDAHDVAIATDLGLLRDDVERSPLDGFYRQTLQAQRRGGTATIRVTVDGEDAGEATLVLEGDEGGCGCAAASPGDASLGATLASLLLAAGRRRRRHNRVTEVTRG
jgi:MYXO-CTERM domain-containing protein